MNARECLDILHIAEKLKDTPRHCTTSGRRTESVAEHSWRVSLMAFMLENEFPEADMARVTEMCLVHDLGECFTGDIPTFVKTSADRAREDELFRGWLSALPVEVKVRLSALYDEMEKQQTLESKIYRALDKLEALIQHNESPLDTWSENEFELNKTYAFDTVCFSDWLTGLRGEILSDTLKKIKAEKPWRLVEYKPEMQSALESFLERCLPESGRALDIEGRHAYYRDISGHFKGFWCMFSGGEMIGTVAVAELNDSDCELKSLYLFERFHGRGYGRELLGNAIENARKMGYRKMYLDSLSTSTRALKLYRRAGFTETERYNTNVHSDVFMLLEL